MNKAPLLKDGAYSVSFPGQMPATYLGGGAYEVTNYGRTVHFRDIRTGGQTYEDARVLRRWLEAGLIVISPLEVAA